MATILQRSYIGGWCSYPPLPDTLRGFKSSFNPDLKVVLLEDLCTLIKNLHFYQHASVSVLSTIAGIEVVQKNGSYFLNYLMLLYFLIIFTLFPFVFILNCYSYICYYYKNFLS